MTESWTDRVAALRPAYQADLARGTDRFFEPRRTTCPWCDSAELRVRLRTTDLIQHKPGRFVLDECTACGHVFQNPRLNPTGLDFYYRDFYDGLGEQQLDGLFKSSTKSYLSRARLAVQHAAPGNWLDVGTGHGHFPHTAATLLPDTVFDGIDQSEGVELAQRRGWITTGYRGHFTELADGLAGRYDAVSMFHYLEHTTDPAAQLAAASRVVRPGGVLLIEVPDPECRYARPARPVVDAVVAAAAPALRATGQSDQAAHRTRASPCWPNSTARRTARSTWSRRPGWRWTTRSCRRPTSRGSRGYRAGSGAARGSPPSWPVCPPCW